MSLEKFLGPIRSRLRLTVRALTARYPFLSEPKTKAVTFWRRFWKIPFEQDFALLAYIRPMPGQVFVDIGANRGQSIDAIRLFHPNVPVASFEANPSLAASLKRRFSKDSNLMIRSYGLGEQPGKFLLFMPNYNGLRMDGLASIDRDSAEGWLNSQRLPGFDPERLKIEEIQCEIRRLDDEGLDPAFIKIDVQGFEPQVLAGGRETIGRAQLVLLIEHDTEPPEMLKELGYSEFRYKHGTLFPVTSAEDRASNSFHLTESSKRSLIDQGVRFA